MPELENIRINMKSHDRLPFTAEYLISRPFLECFLDQDLLNSHPQAWMDDMFAKKLNKKMYLIGEGVKVGDINSLTAHSEEVITNYGLLRPSISSNSELRRTYSEILPILGSEFVNPAVLSDHQLRLKIMAQFFGMDIFSSEAYERTVPGSLGEVAFMSCVERGITLNVFRPSSSTIPDAFLRAFE